MPKKRASTKRKKGKGKPERKQSSGSLPWRNLSIVLLIILFGVGYIFIRYDVLKLPKGTPQPPPSLPTKSERTVNLYYADPNSEKLAAEQRTIPRSRELKQTIATTMRELMQGPEGDLVNTIPSKTVLRGIRIDSDGVVWVDFSTHLSQSHPGGSSAEIMTVYAIVNSILLNFKEVKKVRIIIEGKSVDTLAGHINCSEPFVADRSFIQ